MQTNYFINSTLDVINAKGCISLGSGYIDSINGSYLYRTMLAESIDRLNRIRPLIKNEDDYHALIQQAEQSIAKNLECLCNPDTSILQKFTDVEQLAACYLNFCEQMSLSQSGLYWARKKIEDFLKQFDNELKKISEQAVTLEICKIQLLVLQQQMDQIKEENLVLRRTISILSK